ncbi:MAG: CRISPR-associated protein Csx20 [Methanocaldococcus sp.]|nr:CRISPR-associated protein Csx20 [Methanocaldococcus sp.]MCQ6253565.1 CRISPR-associated protein Csx20 [Methanocaldococcus sp.]
MFLLFSHNLTDDQINDARENLKVDKFIYLPKELQNIWSNIPPEIEDITDYLKPIKEFLKNNANDGDYVLIQGDFGATYNMVNYAFENNLIPIYATTKRVVKEVIEDGKVITIREFKHCRFRKYK